MAIKELNKASDPDCDPATNQKLPSKIISVTQKGSPGAKAKSEKKRVRFDLYSLVEKQIESHKRKFSDDCFFFFVKGSSDLKVLACDIYQALNESSDEKKFSSLEKMEVAKSDGYERIKLLYNYILGSINETDENSRILDVMDYSFSKEYYDLMKGKESEKYIKFFYTGKHLFYRFLLDDENQSQAYSVMQYFTTQKQAEIKQGDPVVKKYINWYSSKNAKSSQFYCSQIPAETKETVDFLKGKEQTDANFSQVSTGIKL